MASIKINQEQTRALNSITEKLEEVSILNRILKTEQPLWIGFSEDPGSASAEAESKYNKPKRKGETEQIIRRVSLDHKSRDKVLTAMSAQRERCVKKIYELANRYAIDLSESDLELIANTHGKRDAEQSTQETMATLEKASDSTEGLQTL